MFFEDHQKLIFSIEGSDKKFDPLAIDRALRKESGNQLAKIIEIWKAPDRDEGDISDQGKAETLYAADQAEEELARISRIVFSLGKFPECTDGEALEWLCQYLDWCKKKGMKDTIVPDSFISGTDIWEPTPEGYKPTKTT